MDTERTMQFIVDNLASITVRQARADRQINGLQTLVKTGMRMLVKLEQGHKRLQGQMGELAASQKRTDQILADLAVQQKRTDQKFERWLDSMNKSPNGHKKRPN